MLSNERDRNFMFFYVLHHSNLTELLLKFDNTAETMLCLPCVREGRRDVRASQNASGNMDINEILRCICMNGWKSVWKCVCCYPRR